MIFETVKDLHEFITLEKKKGYTQWRGMDINFCLKFTKPSETKSNFSPDQTISMFTN